MKQLGLSLNLSTNKTRKREFLNEMERVVPRSALVQVVEPHHSRAKTGRPPFGTETMLPIHYLQQWFALSDPAMEDALHDASVFREFARLDEVSRLPDETTTGNPWNFGMKAHTSVDANSGLVQSLVGTVTSVNDVTQVGALLKGRKQQAFGDAGHLGAHKRLEAQWLLWQVAMRPGLRRKLNPFIEPEFIAEQLERAKASVRAKVEHPFRVLKRQFGCTKVGCRGLTKSTTQTVTPFAPGSL